MSKQPGRPATQAERTLRERAERLGFKLSRRGSEYHLAKPDGTGFGCADLDGVNQWLDVIEYKLPVQTFSPCGTPLFKINDPDDAADAETDMIKPEPAVIAFTPKDDGESITEPDPLGSDGVDDVDLDDHRVGAHVIYGSLSAIDLAKTTPEVFWSLFGTPNGKAGTVKWLNSSIKKLIEIGQGMPE
jgi:hypothetical protein